MAQDEKPSTPPAYDAAPTVDAGHEKPAATSPAHDPAAASPTTSRQDVGSEEKAGEMGAAPQKETKTNTTTSSLGSQQRRLSNSASEAGKPAFGSAEDASDDENTVFWDGEDDPQNPYNWPTWLKVVNCVLISALTFVTPLASSMFAPGVPALLKEFKSDSSELGSFCVSVYILGFAAGPMLFAPLSELYGRRNIYHFANVGFIAFVIACAVAPTLNALIVFRFFSGVFGSCPIANGGGTIADMIVQEKRGAAMASFAIGPLLGPIIGPVVGGVITDKLNWRWVFWIISIIGGVIAIVFFFCSRETYASVLIERKAKRLRKETGNPLLRSKLSTGLTPGELFKRAILRPFKMLAFSPICAICNLYVGVAYGYLYLLFTSLTPLFMRIYNFDTIHAGLAFLGLGVGSMIGVGFFSASSDRYIKKKAKEAGELPEDGSRPKESSIKPEYRLPSLRVGALLLPVGLFIYGWTAYYKVHWIAPIIGTALIGIGNLIIFMSLQLYLVDTFTIYAASALAANSVVRSILGAVLPLAGLPMYAKLGLGWGNSLLGFIAVALIPVPWLFMKYGESLRKKFAIRNL